MTTGLGTLADVPSFKFLLLLKFGSVFVFLVAVVSAVKLVCGAPAASAVLFPDRARAARLAHRA